MKNINENNYSWQYPRLLSALGFYSRKIAKLARLPTKKKVNNEDKYEE